ncbi:armadillo-type protein [Mycena albidolilacea]|uniref:Armadillo-type protein n=1 Tax=Mycena albidolilacea TaxID=1033008 RepID=A0AAD7AD74_9AGAR|nr:armadillo-type protein [Mycena albidolilacea]
MLRSPHPRARICSCRLLGNLAWFESTTPAVLQLKLCEQLVFLLDKKHSDVIREATYALSRIARWEEGAKGVVDAKALDHVLLLLESPNSDTRRWACELTGNLASHESTAPATLQLKPCEQIVSLPGVEFSEATYALSQITRWEDGAKAVVDAKVLDHILPLLESPNPMARKWACELTGRLARYGSTAPAILKLNISVLLVSLLGDEDSVVSRATYALSQIARWVDGAKAVVDAKALDHVLPLLKSPNPMTRKRACELTGHLAFRESTALAILKLNISVPLVSLLGDEDSLVVSQAAYTLSQIARWVDGAKAVVDAKALDHVLPLLESPNPMTREWGCELTGDLLGHQSTAPPIFKSNFCMQLVSLLGDEDPVVCQATYALSQIACWVDGAKGIIDAKVLDHVLPLLESPGPGTRNWACVLVHGLASHGATAPAILQLKPITQLESLLQWVIGFHMHHPG